MATAPGRRTLWFSVLKTGRPALQTIATIFRRTVLARTTVVAVIGSFGKTSTTRAIATALPDAANRCGHYNNESTVSLDLLTTRSRVRTLIYECGIDRQGRMRGFARLVRPDVVVVTSIGREHDRSLGCLDNIRHEKAFMVRAVNGEGTVILNADDPNVMWMASQTAARIVTFGFADGADIRGIGNKLLANGRGVLDLEVDGRTYTIESGLLGTASARALLAAVAAARTQGVPSAEAVNRLQGLEAVDGRLYRSVTADGLVVISDEFKSPVETMVEALETLGSMAARRRIAVLGPAHAGTLTTAAWTREVGPLAASACNMVLFVGHTKEYRLIRSAAAAAGMARGDIVRVRSEPAAIAAAVREFAGPGDVVLFKGRQYKLFERARLLLFGRDVRCTRVDCRLNNSCGGCELLSVVDS